MANLYSGDNPVFSAFAFYGSILITKMFLVQLTVGLHRISEGVRIVGSYFIP